MEWITPIFDRTSDDVANVLALINVIQVDGWDSLPADDQEKFLGELRGTFSKVTIERIINNTQFLVDKLYEYGYNKAPIVYQKGTWAYSDIPTISDLNLLVRNLQALLDTFYNVTGELPSDLSTVELDEVNAIERALFDINAHIDKISEHRLWCGTVACGQTVVGGLKWKTE